MPCLPRRPLAVLALLAAALALSGCIEVADISAKWKACSIDPALEGVWTSKEQDKEKKTLFIKQKDNWYLMTATGDDKAMAVRCFEAGGAQFMIWVPIAQAVIGFDAEGADKKGTVVHYAIRDGKLNFFALDQDFLKQAIVAKEVAGTSNDKESTKLTCLDDATCAFLGKAAGDKAHWQTFGGDMKKNDPAAAHKPVAPAGKPLTP